MYAKGAMRHVQPALTAATTVQRASLAYIFSDNLAYPTVLWVTTLSPAIIHA